MGSSVSQWSLLWGMSMGWPRSRTLPPSWPPEVCWGLRTSLAPAELSASPTAAPPPAPSPSWRSLGSVGGAAGHLAHQDMEIDPLTVFLAGGEQGSSVGVPVPALIQVGPRRVPPLIHGGVIPDA